MSWLWMFIIGLIVGIVAKFLMPGRDPGGFIVTAILGIAGMFVGGWLSHVLFGTTGPGGEVEPSGFIGGVIGAIILLALYRLLFKRNTV
ncbi:MAG TPA: GlsB/YeaQ/YmgE family stress response membrane protein [Dokdonella sp.]